MKEKVGPAIGRVSSGVYIVTFKNDKGREGMLATWVGQIAFAPPMLSIAINKEREILNNFAHGAKFAINVLAKKNMNIFKNFAKPYEEGLDRFEDLEVEEDSQGAPIFTRAVAYLSLKVASIAEAGDHSLVLGEVIDGRVLNGEDEPMVHLRKSGFQY
ncbi:MAG: flavin reductase family protein [Candidatus Obscuribacterales bacterium]|nr:flavin reductase family protein [Candidatus Obscuribacterales bacterium]